MVSSLFQFILQFYSHQLYNRTQIKEGTQSKMKYGMTYKNVLER